MLLYNVSFNLNNTDNILIPSVPKSAADDEDKEIARVCLADSVEHCIQAIASGNRYIAKNIEFIVREVNVDKKSRKLINPKRLKSTKRVPDAIENNEYWYLGNIQCKVYKCKIIEFETAFELAWSCISKRDCKRIIHKYCKEINLEKCSSSYEMYQRFCNYSNQYKLWDEQDFVWDDLSMLPWAQKLQVTKIEFKHKRIK